MWQMEKRERERAEGNYDRPQVDLWREEKKKEKEKGKMIG